MPASAPGRRVPRTATKEVRHGDPCVEHHAVGVAYKSKQEGPALPSYAEAQEARQIKVGEEFIVNTQGRVWIRTVLLPSGVTEGSTLYIKESNNALVAASEAGTLKFGIVETEPESSQEWTAVNLTLRNTY